MNGKSNLIWISLLSLLGVVVSGELFARYSLGLGTPPLSVTHPTIEYMFRPNQNVYRFGNHFIVNQYGMRTEPFVAQKGVGEFRIMVFGDSVLNGGSQTDHALLATTILKNRIADQIRSDQIRSDQIRSDHNQEMLDRNVVVGNISAGSWGPGNWLAYAKEYGFLEADVIVLVISSHDEADNPTFQTLDDSTHPTANPSSALLEGFTRYLPRYLSQPGVDNKTTAEKNQAAANQQQIQQGLDDLKGFLQLAKSASTHVLVFQHWAKPEIESSSAEPGNQHIKSVCEQMGISPVSLEPYFRRSIKSGINPYRDDIHPNQIGQQLIAEAIFDNIASLTKL